MVDSLGGRKVVAAAVTIAVAVGVTALKGDVPANLLALLQVVFGTFVVGNLGEHAAAALKRPEGAEPLPQVDLTPVEDEMRAIGTAVGSLQSELAEVKGAVGTTQQGMAVILQMAQRTG